MTGRVAQDVKFPDGVSLDSAKEAAQAAFDVLQRFGLQPVSAFGDTLDFRRLLLAHMNHPHVPYTFPGGRWTAVSGKIF
jgi:hypothetical protein